MVRALGLHRPYGIMEDLIPVDGVLYSEHRIGVLAICRRILDGIVLYYLMIELCAK